ncbi:MAG: hypothetical protein IM550_06570 [Microcystis sp. M54BS1]|uniref:hypothetical protein n=1 Tax=unclassified Microcystis TaxID=2643300 RepID=UPI0025800475|nr:MULTISPECIES: hypothetical protein [unclassified Microcystis]MCA2504779.1 hypothetical protein [Microcystis sp. M62BS1]MCA2538904.1 hypothetical protein [Microcystis sp. M54BS1]MCA2548337.1 hypothetical protein [Microcystis sp. M53BS1]MCA2569428.1 hypothetical protein [Microcystis sp. M44BS1]MCA2596548.1 hypothetical protein [Microcystis sp. M38BS1]MCA2611975.1 hypothetical protein [Microcystis sp. M27BS1]
MRSAESSLSSLQKGNPRTGNRSSAGLKILVRAVTGIKELSQPLTKQRETLTITGYRVETVDASSGGSGKKNLLAK